MDGSTNATTAVSPSLAASLTFEASQSFPTLLSQVSAFVVLIWDILITLDLEIELVWKARNSAVKFVYLFIRYLALSQAIITLTLLGGDFKTKHNICRVYAWYYSFSGILLLSGVDIILIYRAFAFYARDRRVLIGLMILWAMNGTAVLVLSVLISINFPIYHSLTFYIPGIIGECDATSFPQLLHVIWISELIFQSILFILVLVRSIAYFTFIKVTVTSWNRTVGMSAVYLVFIRDGIWAYFLLFGLFLGCAIWNELTGLSLIQWVFVFTAVAGSRLVLNLRSLYATPHDSHDAPSLNWRIASLPGWAGREVLFDTIYEPEVDTAMARHKGPSKFSSTQLLGNAVELGDLHTRR